MGDRRGRRRSTATIVRTQASSRIATATDDPEDTVWTSPMTLLSRVRMPRTDPRNRPIASITRPPDAWRRSDGWDARRLSAHGCRSHEQNGDARLLQRRGCDAAQELARDTAAPAGSHRDEMGTAGAGCLGDRGRRIAHDSERRHRALARRHGRSHRVEIPLGLAQLLACRVLRGAVIADRWRQPGRSTTRSRRRPA
jgi:hypothetical protein